MITPINYIEFKSNDLEQTKSFYEKVFGSKFLDYEPNYCAFSECRVEGGFEFSEEPIVNGVLVSLHSNELGNIKEGVVKYGGRLVKEIFHFPERSRFEFVDHSGNQLAVWKDLSAAE